MHSHSPKPVLGVDLGGTKVMAALAAESSSTQPFLFSSKNPTEGRSSRDQILANLFRTIDEVLSAARLSPGDLGGLGVCVPGIVDAARGVVVDCTNLAGWQEVPLQSLLEDRYGLPVAVDNDARAACWAEATTGAGSGVATQAFVTVSTGIGAALVLDGRLYRGVHSVAGELGETRWPGAGTAEQQVSGTALVSRFGIRAEELEDRCLRGDPDARKAFGCLVDDLGLLLANLCSLIDPGLIVVGGGVAHLGRFLLDPLEAEVRRQAYSLSKQVRLVQARWMGEAGVRGMMALSQGASLR